MVVNSVRYPLLDDEDSGVIQHFVPAIDIAITHVQNGGPVLCHLCYKSSSMGLVVEVDAVQEAKEVPDFHHSVV